MLQNNVQIPGTEGAVTGRLTAGSTYTTTQSEALTIGTSASVEVGASFFEIFSASVNAEVSQETTSTSTSGIDVLVDCESGQEGIIYWYPVFTVYQGRYTPSGDNVDFYIPDNSASGQSNFGIRCLY